MSNHRILGCAAVLSASLFAAPVFSQLEEITVTATKRESTLQEVPVAVSVTDAQTIQQAQVLDILDLQTLVPSLRVTQLQSSGNTNFVIRGFGNGANNVGIEPSVGVFIDGVYRSRSAAAISDLTNIERVEVLRGPQSTLFGKNASAGVISVITALPDEELSGSLEAYAGNYGLVGLKGNVSIPLSDVAGLGLSVGSNQRDGYFDNLETGSEINVRDRWNVRAQLAITPQDNVSVRVIADYDELDEKCCGTNVLLPGPTAGVIRLLGADLVTDSPFGYSNYYDTDPVNKVENSGISVQIDYDFENSTLTSITSFRGVNRKENIDPDFTSASLLAGLISETDLNTFTQEFRLSSSAGESVDWLLGAFYFEEDVTYDSEAIWGSDARLYVDLLASIEGGTFPPVPGTLGFVEGQLAPFGVMPGDFFRAGTGAREFTGQDNQALSLFAQVDWYVSDRTTITLGANYTQDEKDAFTRQLNNDVFSALDFVDIGFQSALLGGATIPEATFISTNPCTDPPTAPCNSLLGFQQFQPLKQFVNFPNSVESGNTDDSDVTWTARLAFDLTDNVNMYVSASTGFKASSWNLSRDSRPFISDIPALESAGLTVPNLTTGTRFAAPEESTVYELGLKARFDKGAVNVAIFDQTLEGFQSNLFGGLGFNLTNAGEQSATGLELDASYYPVESLQLTFAGTFMDPVYDSFIDGLGPGTDLTGQKPASIHEQSIVTSATWSKDLAGGSSFFIRGEYLYESDAQVVDNIPASVASREVNVVNASFGLSTPGGWDFTVWGRNLTDDEYLISAFPATFQDGQFNGYPSQPATYGVTLRKYFD
ncbi:MAG: TonB-dependent receptor [Gammaproteobacteria bacterium]|nr:TonB-dependent receptor [Gammaproteobacteria bacterium]NNL45680.1 TonB-dependent receptor [Woeseiaceae bacterium]